MTSTATKPAPPQLIAAMNALRAGDLSRALASAEAGLNEAGDRAPFLAVAGLAAQRMGEPARAVGYLRELHATNPADQATRSNLARALVESGALQEALELAAGGTTPGLARTEAFARQQLGDLAGAAAAYRRALALDPADLPSLNNLGNVLAALGETDEAVSVFEQAITLAPQEVGIYLNLANVLRQADRSGPRLKVSRDAAAIAPNDRFVLTELALAYAHDDQFEEALRLLEDICERFPSFGESQLELGRMYESFNRIEDLAALVSRVEADNPPPEAGFLGAWLALREGRFDDAARRAAAIPETIHPMRRFHLIGSIEERRGNSRAAFAAFERMNAEALADAPRPPAESFRARVMREQQGWSDEWAAGWPAIAPDASLPRDPIFLVGFPRSGTTLLDTMLMGLPELSVLEERPMVATLAKALRKRDLTELDEGAVTALRKDYFALARSHGWDDQRWLVDKQPLNMTKLPLIHRLFPKARFILAERHPYDVVLSCFMANFQLNFAMRSFTSLDEAARTYDAVFSSWEKASRLFAVDFRTVRYERLVVDPGVELRPLVEWLGLDWSDDLLDHRASAQARGRVRTASYSQIGEPLYQRARYRWKRYADELEPVIPILEPWAERLGYETR